MDMYVFAHTKNWLIRLTARSAATASKISIPLFVIKDKSASVISSKLWKSCVTTSTKTAMITAPVCSSMIDI